MPTITDAIVVNQAHDTSGNGGRKIVRLANGTLVSATINNYIMYIHKSTDNGLTWTQHFATSGGANAVDVIPNVSIASKGNVVYALFGIYDTSNARHYEFYTINFNTNINSKIMLDSNVSSVEYSSILVHESEIHATWSCRTSPLPQSYNIRYVKGTINSDLSVSWGTVEQVTKMNNSGVGYANFALAPSVVIHNKNVIITAATLAPIDSGGVANPNNKGIIALNRKSGNASQDLLSSGWYAKNIFEIRDKVQYSPSAIVQGELIATAWHGTDETQVSTDYVRFSKSVDGGVTWSAMKKIVPGKNASLTANRDGKLFITYEDTGVTKRIESTDNGDTWSTPVTIGNGTNPSTLFDIGTNGFDYSEPLTVRKGSTTTLFNGKWTITTSSIPEGSIGQKTSGDNLLSYAIATEGSMSPIVEKVNGQIVNTRSSTVSGQQYTVSLTDPQWDEVKYGKYANATGTLNEITIEMGKDKWTYAFDKRLSTEAGMSDVSKASMDAANVSTPAKKTKLIEAVRSKGGTLANGATTEEIAEAIKGMSADRNAEGTATSNPQSKLIVNGLGFRPSIIRWYSSDKSGMGYWDAQMTTNYVKLVSLTTGNSSSVAPISGAVITDNGFEVTVDASKTYTWYASE